MSEYVTLEDAAKARGESPDTIAWLMTTKDCKIYLRFDESQKAVLLYQLMKDCRIITVCT